MKKFIKSFYYAFQGIISSLKQEKNMKVHIIIMIIVIICGIIFKISKIEWIICIILFALVISLELVNTSIEKTVDLITQEKNEIAKIAKDVAAGAVVLSSLNAVIIAILIVVGRII